MSVPKVLGYRFRQPQIVAEMKPSIHGARGSSVRGLLTYKVHAAEFRSVDARTTAGSPLDGSPESAAACSSGGGA